MTSIWNFLEQTSLAGKYQLHELLSESDGIAFFRATFGPDQQNALAKLVPETSPEASEKLLEQWRTASVLSHPNVLRLLDCGCANEDFSDSFLFAVFEFPDDTLAAAASHGALSAEETREVLVAALEGLAYIHHQGLVHGSIDADHVVAVGNQIKLASDPIRLPSRDAAAADDVRSLGALVYQLITGRRVEPGVSPYLASIPEPFRTVIQHSLVNDPSQRWSLLQIAAASHPPTQPVAGPTPPSRKIAASRHEIPKWIYVATPAFLIALILILRGVHPKSEVPAAPPPLAAVTQAAVPAKPAPVRTWRVIAYTYFHREQADKRAESINRKWSGAQAEVLPSGNAKREAFLIALGGPMSREDAVRFQKIARSHGMPRGTAIRNNLP